MGALRKPKTSKSLAEFDRTEWNQDGTFKPGGWYQIPKSFWDDIPRLRSGAVQGDLLWYLVRLTFGLEPSRREAGWPEWTPLVRWDELAERIHTTDRSVRREAEEAAARKVIEVDEKAPRGFVRFRLCWKLWSKLTSYEDIPRPELVKDPPKEEVRAFDRPFQVRDGKTRNLRVGKTLLSLRPIGSDADFNILKGPEEKVIVEVGLHNQLDTKTNVTPTSESVAVSSPDKKVRPTKKEPVLQVPRAIVEAAAPFGLVNDGALLQLIADCQSYAQECTVEEIAEEVARVGNSAGRKVDNIPSLICSVVPKYFNSTAYRSGIKPGSRKPTESAMSERDRKVFEAMEFTRRHRTK